MTPVAEAHSIYLEFSPRQGMVEALKSTFTTRSKTKHRQNGWLTLQVTQLVWNTCHKKQFRSELKVFTSAREDASFFWGRLTRQHPLRNISLSQWFGSSKTRAQPHFWNCAWHPTLKLRDILEWQLFRANRVTMLWCCWETIGIAQTGSGNQFWISFTRLFRPLSQPRLLNRKNLTRMLIQTWTRLGLTHSSAKIQFAYSLNSVKHLSLIFKFSKYTSVAYA